jgi:predicted dehydrogenase
MDHASGAHSLVEISFSYCHTAAEPVNHFTYEIIGTDGVIRYDRAARLFELRNSRGTQTLEWHEEKGFDAMYAAFEEAVRTGRSADLPTARDGLIATRLAWTATHNAMSRRSGVLKQHAAARA